MSGHRTKPGTGWTATPLFFTVFKLPAYVTAAVWGFIFEFIYELPFMVVCLLSTRFRRK